MILHRTPLVALLAFPKSNMREKKRNCGLSCKNRLMYPVVNGISGSLNCIPFFQSPGFRIPQTKLISLIPESLFIYTGR